MANHKSAEKRARQTIRRTERKSATKSSLRTTEKKLRQSIASKDKDQAADLLKKWTSQAGKAAQKGILHSNQVSRKVSRLSQQIHSLGK